MSPETFDFVYWFFYFSACVAIWVSARVFCGPTEPQRLSRTWKPCVVKRTSEIPVCSQGGAEVRRVK
jgi:hypothetical protein